MPASFYLAEAAAWVRLAERQTSRRYRRIFIVFALTELERARDAA